MSDFLVNLARRSAGLSPVVRARSVPVIDVSDTNDAPAVPAVERGVNPSAPNVGTPMISPPPRDTVEVRLQPLAALATPIVQAPARVAQRTSAASESASQLSARSVQPAPVVAPRPQSLPAGNSTVGENPLATNAKATVDRHHEAPDDISTPAAAEVQGQIVESGIERVTIREPSDAPSPVVVTIKPAEQVLAIAQNTRAEPAEERSVYVRIGAIDIFGPDAPAQSPSISAAAVPATVASAAATSSGFEDYRALRSYAPWAW